MKLDDIERIYFLGIGGIGMSALARYFLANNFEVAGYDRDQSAICISLINDSCQILFDDDPRIIPTSFREKNKTLVVYTPAISKNNKLIKYFIDQDYLLCKRAEILGTITQNLECLAIAGTHGKTTISSLLAYILSDNLIDCSAFLGGIATDFDSNLKIGSADVAVVEADEFDRSFLKLSPNWALISSMDADHLDIYGTAHHLVESFRLFSDMVEDGNLIVKEGLDMPSKYTYALGSDTADFSAKNIRVEGGAYYFDLVYPKGVCENVITGLPGIHNVENALAAFSMAYIQGLSVSGIVDSIASFSGVKRRFEYHVKTDNQIYIDDYAHHPKEIEVAIRSVRDLYPNKELTVIFQPHLFTRTRDFMDDFAKSLSFADHVMLLDVYPARELPIEGVNSQVLLNKITVKNKGLYDKSKFPEAITKSNVLMTLGAGDIDQLIEPIKAYLVS
ncbi:MAG: UDP-N-acetylmuramate--L-alanine ligase [Flavobacteriales bacterium]|nr:UDP-N-acetylmuramate--L-alanine ligase [Flavobacteriales bacterium]